MGRAQNIAMPAARASPAMTAQRRRKSRGDMGRCCRISRYTSAMKRFHLLSLVLLAPSACFADDWNGFRADVFAADAVVRFSTSGVKPLTGDDVEVTASIEKVFKGEGVSVNDSLKLVHHAGAYEARLGAELRCPGGVTAGGM